MRINQTLSKEEKRASLIFLIILFCICGICGIYAGGYVLLLLTGLNTSILEFTTLLQALALHKSVALHLPLIAGIATCIVTALAAPAAALLMIFFEFDDNVFGNAKEITDKELEDSALLQVQDKYPEILIGRVASGKHQGKYLKFSGQQFIGLAAPTRSGKGVGFVIPNLLNYRDSVCILDIKAENFILTAGFRQQHQDVFMFAPDGYRFSKEEYQKFKQTSDYLSMTQEEQEIFDKKYQAGEYVCSHRWNPLSYISRSHSKRLSEIKDMAAILYPDSEGDNAIWNSMAASLFTGFVLYMLDMEHIQVNMLDSQEAALLYPVNMAQLFSLTGVANIADWMNEEILYWQEQETPLSSACVESFNRFISLDPKTRGNVMQNFNQPLAVFEAESCRLATSVNDFNFNDLRRKRMSIYIVLNPSGIAKYSRLVNLFFSQLITENTKTLPEHDSSLKYQCLLMLDEFTSIGKVAIIEKSIAFTAGYNLRYMLIYQDDAQLESKYTYAVEGAKSIKSNLAVEVVFPPKTVDKTAERVSKTFGRKTIKVKSHGRSGGFGTVASNSTNEQYQGRDLYMPQEIVELGAKKYIGKNGALKNKVVDIGINEIIIMEKMKPFIAHKIIYFDEPAFLERKEFATQNIPLIPFLKDSKVYIAPRKIQNSKPMVSTHQEQKEDDVKKISKDV